MATVEQFLADILPSQGFRFVFLNFRDGKPAQRDFSIDETDTLIGFAKWGAAKKADAYIAIGGYCPAPDGKMFRQAQYAYLHRCLRLDLDCGPSKDYPTKRDALKALGEFCTHYKITAPWVIDSGGGLHVYWPFTRDVSLAEWLSFADRLRAACNTQGLKVDGTTTNDAARVLRIPGSFNFKEETPRAVVILGAGTPVDPNWLVGQFPTTASGFALPMTGVPALPGMADDGLSGGRFPPYFMKDVITQCPGMQDMFATRGANAAEPLWKLTLDLINRSDETATGKEKLARHMSSGHRDFQEGTFIDKWSQVQRQNYHPPTCQRMSDAGMQACKTCPLKAAVSTPSALGRPKLQEIAAPCNSPAIPMPQPLQLPQAFQPLMVQPIGVFLLTGASTVQVIDGNLTKDVGIRKGLPCTRVVIKEKAPDGTETEREWYAPIMQYRILEVERLLDTVGAQSITAITIDRNSDGPKKIEFTNKALSEPQTFVSLMYAHGIHMTRKQAAQLQDVFMPEFLSQLQRARAANQIAGRCGWTDDQSGFVLGTRLFSKGKIEHVRPATAPEEMEAYHSAGDEISWRRAFDVTLSGGTDRQAVLALAIAAPLMVFTGLDGVLLNAYSPESGVGKSTLCDAALSIWGSPNKLRKDFRDTANATFKLASIVGNLPMVVDEFTNVEGRALSDYIYTITQGREKHRLTADSKLNASSSRWCLPTIVTSNNSVHEKLQAYRADAVAEAARVFELRLKPLNVSMDEMGRIKLELLGLRSNYGFLGPKLVEMFLSKPPEYWREMVGSRIAWWDKEVAVDASDRFRSATAALIDIGCALGRAMGFDFHRAQVIDTIRMQWQEQQTEFEAARKQPLDFINGFIVEHLSDFAVLGGVTGDAAVSGAPRRFFGEIRSKTINGKPVTQSLMVPLDLLREYVREKNGNFKAINEWMRDEMNNGGHVLRMGKLIFLEGQYQQMQTQAVEFRASVLGGVKLAVHAPDPNNIPAAPAIKNSGLRGAPPAGVPFGKLNPVK